MAIVLNAGSTPNGQMPSIRIYGDGNVGEHSLLGNFGELLTLISADAKNALHENELNPQITVKQTSEALLALAKNGNEEAKNIVASILQRAAPENQNPLTLSLKENIQTSSFLEAKIENKLEQQGLLKPSKTLEFLSLSDLVTFADDLLSKTAGGVEQNARNERIAPRRIGGPPGSGGIGSIITSPLFASAFLELPSTGVDPLAPEPLHLVGGRLHPDNEACSEIPGGSSQERMQLEEAEAKFIHELRGEDAVGRDAPNIQLPAYSADVRTLQRTSVLEGRSVSVRERTHNHATRFPLALER